MVYITHWDIRRAGIGRRYFQNMSKRMSTIVDTISNTQLLELLVPVESQCILYCMPIILTGYKFRRCTTTCKEDSTSTYTILNLWHCEEILAM